MYMYTHIHIYIYIYIYTYAHTSIQGKRSVFWSRVCGLPVPVFHPDSKGLLTWLVFGIRRWNRNPPTPTPDI